jgi:DNA-binding MarR family transcriptional regulator
MHLNAYKGIRKVSFKYPAKVSSANALRIAHQFIRDTIHYIHRENHAMQMPDGRILAKRLIDTKGAPRILMALLQSGPSYVKSLSYDTRLVDTTVRSAIVVLLDMKLIKLVAVSANQKVPHAKEYYDLTPIGREIALQLQEHDVEMAHLLEKLTHQHRPT